MSRLPWLMAVALGCAPLISCNKTVECGAGTVEEEGVCISTTGETPGGNCGGGTCYEESSGTCRPNLYADMDGGLVCGAITGLPTYCGDNTAVEVNAAGLQVCVGTAPPSDCNAPTSCPAPTGGITKISVCGRLFDTQTTAAIEGDAALRIEVRLYDPLGFVADPAGTPPLNTVYTDSCGRYQALDITRPFSGFIAVATEDLDVDMPENGPDDGMDLLWLTGVAAAADGGATITGLNAFVTRKETDAMWTLDAGLTGATFAERGVYVPIFLDPLGTHLDPFDGEPVADVQITQGDATDPAKDYYFSDTDPMLLTRGTIDPLQTVTGTNGSGLWINGSLVLFSGTGAEPAGCMWPSTLAATPAGVVFVQERIATGGPCDM